MALTQPILNTISAFDATQSHIFKFVSIGGDQVVGSKINIYDNETGSLVYTGNNTSFKFEFPLQANILTNGKYYNATISTINIATQFSVESNPVAFYCYTAPSMTITNIPLSGTVEASSYEFIGNYMQSEGELLNGYQYTLYDSNKSIIEQSEILYDELYKYTFIGFSNDTSYYISFSGYTINNTEVTSGLIQFTVRYLQPSSFAICDLVNNCDNGYIQISSNIVAIDGASEPTPPIYINNEEVDLRDVEVIVPTISDMNNWSSNYHDRFDIQYNSSLNTNEITCNTGNGWEIIYIPITTIVGRNYNINFDFQDSKGYNTLLDYKGIGYQILNTIEDNDNLNNSLNTKYLPNSILYSIHHETIKFTATSTTTYFAFNFGMAADNQIINISLGNFSVFLDDAYVNWANGFNVQNDFTMRVWGRDFQNNETIIEMNNNEDTTLLPNKIEMKYMNTNIIDILPNYLNDKKQLITTSDSQVEPIKNLKIEGRTMTSKLILPNGYTQVDFISSSGTQYIDLNFKPNQNTSIEWNGKILNNTTASLYGARNSSQVNEFSTDFINPNNIEINYGTSQINISNIILNKMISLKQDMYNNNLNNINQTSSTINTFQSDYSIFLFGKNEGNTLIQPISASLYNFKLYDNGKLIRNLIPCFRNSDNIIGLYDIINNIFYINLGTGNFTYNEIVTTQSPNCEAKITNTGDIINYVNFADTTLSYSQENFVVSQPINKYILLPNRIYTFSFNYTVNMSTTDLYYSLGYGNADSYISDLTINGNTNIEYTTQNSGKNVITFQTPSSFNGTITPYLWFKLAKTIILADINVSVSKVSLNFGKTDGEYQNYGYNNIPFTISTSNLFNYDSPLFVLDNNTTHSNITNGYQVNFITSNVESYLLIGFNNNLIQGNAYTLSYQTLGELSGFNFYCVRKGTSNIINEITLENGTFTAPSNSCDFMLKFNLDSSNELYSLNVWNIQIVSGSSLLEYNNYNSNIANIILQSSLKNIDNIADLITMKTINLLNPTTLIANVKENTKYYFSNNVSQNFLLEFYNIENNLISTLNIQSGVLTTPTNCSFIKSADFNITNVNSDKIQIEEGESFSQYVPYISNPSEIRTLSSIIYNGSETNWNYDSTHNRFYIDKPVDLLTGGKSICNYFVYGNTETLNYVYNIGSTQIFFSNSDFSSVDEWKAWLSTHNIYLLYQLNNIVIISLSTNQINLLSNMKTFNPVSNIYINSFGIGYIDLDYVNGYTEQLTEKKYALLKCWNKNTLPYIIHSNYIIVNNSNEKIFIWLRKKNNLFDLQISNLGEGELS